MDYDTNFIGRHMEELIPTKENENSVSLDVLSTVLSKVFHDQQVENNKYEQHGPWKTADNFRVNYKGERKFKLYDSRIQADENVIDVRVKYLKQNCFNVVITGSVEGFDVTYQDVCIEHMGEIGIKISIKDDYIYKARYYLTENGNIRVLKHDGSITHYVNKMLKVEFR